MEPLRRAAFHSVGRACAFGFLAIFTTMAGVSFDPLLAMRTGGLLSMLMALVLILKARSAHAVKHHRTEFWLMLDEKDRPPADLAQWASVTVLREAYFWFARWTAGIAALLLALALVLSLLGVRGHS